MIFAAQAKACFYCRDAVCEYIFKRGGIPLNPFRLFGYFLADRIQRDVIRRASATLIRRCDQVWVFGRMIAESMLFEILCARKLHKPIRLFTIDSRAAAIREISLEHLDFEQNVYLRTGMQREKLIRKIFGKPPAARQVSRAKRA
jgi:hypothetical protein